MGTCAGKRLKILLIIDHFGGGGAQRQMVALACGLKKRGHVVEIFMYFSQYDFFRRRVEDCGIPIHECKKGGRFSFRVLKELSKLMRFGGFDIAISYLNGPNIYSELSKLMARRPQLIVSERSSHHADRSVIGSQFRRAMHVFADHLVTNSQAHSRWLMKKPWLGHRITCIYNGIDLDLFKPVPLVPSKRDNLRFLVIGRVGPEKNAIRLIAALHVLHEDYGYIPEISWVGRRDNSAEGLRYCQQVDALLESLPDIQNRWHWLGERSDIPELLAQHHALIHPSLHEGLPNVVCEALAAGRPVLVSDVCDHPRLIEDGERGFLFDPEDPKNIAAAIESLASITEARWHETARNARKYAEENLSLEKYVQMYEALFTKLIERGREPATEME